MIRTESLESKIIRTLKMANGSDKVSIISLGRVLMVCNGVDTIHRLVCSNSKEAAKTADRIQKAYEEGYFTNKRAM